jgi:hypothetical protein
MLTFASGCFLAYVLGLALGYKFQVIKKALGAF